MKLFWKTSSGHFCPRSTLQAVCNDDDQIFNHDDGDVDDDYDYVDVDVDGDVDDNVDTDGTDEHLQVLLECSAPALPPAQVS